VQSFFTEVVGAGVTAGAGQCASPCSLTWTGTSLRPGTHPSIQGPMGLYGMLVVTTAPAGAVAGTAYPTAGGNPAVTYATEVPLLFSEIDPVQNEKGLLGSAALGSRGARYGRSPRNRVNRSIGFVAGLALGWLFLRRRTLGKVANAVPVPALNEP
jgi:hypothetical protein